MPSTYRSMEDKPWDAIELDPDEEHRTDVAKTALHRLGSAGVVDDVVAFETQRYGGGTTAPSLERLDEAVSRLGGVWSIRVETGSEAPWTAEVRISPSVGAVGAPDRSGVFIQAGGDGVLTALGRALSAALEEVDSWEEPRTAG